MIIAEQMEQGSEAWFNIRKGRATASEFNKILTAGGKLSSSSEKYMQKLTRECLMDDPHEFMGNKFTDWGNDMEPEAREFFQLQTGLKVAEVGFVARQDGAPIGCSPDGLVWADGELEYDAGLEIKCPQVDTHVGYVMAGVLPNAYKLQVHGSMAVTGLNSWYFISYFPGLNPLILKVERDEFTELVSNTLDMFVIRYAGEREQILDAILPQLESHVTDVGSVDEDLELEVEGLI
jgi:putative phage-type endonuclease